MKKTLADNQLIRLLAKKKEGLLNIYCTAGFPNRNDTVTVVRALEQAGADMVEIGIPFSDPLADGPVIQHSSNVALQNGMRLELLFTQLETLKNSCSIPLILMGYVNPVLQYGVEKFCNRCAETGVSGVILPDLPLDLYLEKYRETFTKYGISNIFLITPQTSPERIRLIDRHSTGFIYAVSSASTTGSRNNITDASGYFQRIAAMQLENPVLTGFNIRDNASYQMASRHTNGAIIGSAFIRAIENSSNLEEDISTFVKTIKKKPSSIQSK